jgi:tetratricopeptide (TPR) repeat protein
MIYASRGQWTSSWEAANGIYQLQHALATAGRLAKQDIKNYRPLPQLHKLLGDGLKVLNNAKQAHAQYLSAAAEYLDIDNLIETEKALQVAAVIAEQQGLLQNNYQESIKKIFEIRKKIFQLNPEKLDSFSPEHKKIQNELEEISPSLMTSNSFFKRQYFKILADIGHKADLAGNKKDAINFQTKALEIIARERLLTSMEDYIRLQKINTTISAHIEIEGEEKAISLLSSLETQTLFAGNIGWWLPSSSDISPYQITSREDLILAGRIANKKIKSLHLFDHIQKITIKSGIVTLYKKQVSTINIQHTIEVLKFIPGVKDVGYAEKSVIPILKKK